MTKKIELAFSENETTMEDLSKISAITTKNLPELIKFYDNLNSMINKKEKLSKADLIISLINKDNEAGELINKLLVKISEITESN